MRPNKTLGQHFLKSRRALKQIVGAARIQTSGEDETTETVLEIGPGKGVLTEALLEAGARVVAVEKDQNLLPLLEEKFGAEIDAGKLTLIAGDILEIEPEKIGLKKGAYKIVANIPYYITGQIIRTFLSGTCQPTLAVLLVQKEVAARIVARDGKESLLSLAVKAYGEPRRIANVSREDFSPAPKVDSAILLIDNINKNFFTHISEETFFEILHAGFGHKRKKLIRNLETLETVADQETLKNIFADCDISENARAEDLRLEDWKKLTEKIAVA